MVKPKSKFKNAYGKAMSHPTSDYNGSKPKTQPKRKKKGKK